MDQTNLQGNSSGRGKESVVPPEIRRWNWGAFLLHWIWGIGNNTYIALLMFVPLVNLVMPFVLGAKGSEWAWRNRAWRDVEHFKKTQRKWACAGLILIFVLVPTYIGISMTAMKQNEAYRLSISEIQGHEEVKTELGEPITAGLFVTGNVSMSGPDGRAALQYTVKGTKAEGEASVYAIKHAGQWELKQVVVEVTGTKKRISVVPAERQHWGPSLEL